MARPSRGALQLLVALLGCGLGCGGTAPPPPPPMTLSLQLGTVDTRLHGDARWVDFTDDRQSELAPGAQGGFHVWVLYRIGQNDRPRKVRIERIADRLGEGGSRQRVLTTSNTLELGAEPYESPLPIPSFMCPTPIGVNILDAPLELLVRISESDDATALLAEKRVRLQPICPPVGDDQRDFCLRICTG